MILMNQEIELQNAGLFKQKKNTLMTKLKTTLNILLSIVIIIGILGVKSYSWSGPGHMIVAYLAYKNLKPDVKARVDQLVAMNPKIADWRSQLPENSSLEDQKMMLFMILATWADQIKNDHKHIQDGSNSGNTPPTDGTAALNIGYDDKAMHKYWHFIDMPFSTDGTSLKNPDIPNAVTQIKAFRSVLASNESEELKSYDLAWLVHVVGDVHQPLHCAARFTKVGKNGDDGGNNVTACSPACDSLHGFWDGIFGTARDPKVAIPRAIAAAVNTNKAPQALTDILDENIWVNESFTIAKETVYKNPPIKNGNGPFKITETYRNNAIIVGNKQVALAGARLALILNKELK